jgi:FixJ family two-component response regulator
MSRKCSTRMAQNKINVAVVDDDEGFASAIERRFRLMGFEASTYSSAELFLASTALPRPDCLVLDVQLGGMSGLDLQRRLGEAGARTPIIFVTAYDLPAIRKEAEQGGCSAFFLKPVPTKLLLQAIHKAVSPSGDDSQQHAANKTEPTIQVWDRASGPVKPDQP